MGPIPVLPSPLLLLSLLGGSVTGRPQTNQKGPQKSWDCPCSPRHREGASPQSFAGFAWAARDSQSC